VATLHARYGARHFEITDEALAPKLLLRLADALDDYPAVRPRFVGYARLEPGFTPEVCRRVYEMGMRKLFFGLESGSQATLDHMDKGIRVDDAKAVLRNCSDAGIAFHLFSIIGFPEENEASARETAQFFVDNAEVIDQARNTFDIHPFSLDLRTEYAEQAASFGVDIDVDDLAGRDFPVTAMRWRNGRGLDQPDVDRLLEEFHAQLRRTYRTFHQYPLFVWPGYEEYTVLYGDHYESQPFPFRISLPSAHDATPIRLVWAPDARIKATDDGYVVSGPFSTARVGENALALLARPREPATANDLLASLAAPFLQQGRERGVVLDELRTVIDWLLGTGALELVSLAAEPVTR
jgi:anaerobic magnesium-protoporphyrin IX monomethyl ester cyclase